MEILAMLPWELIIYAIAEFFIGKTNWVESNSLLELIEKIIKKLMNKQEKI